MFEKILNFFRRALGRPEKHTQRLLPAPKPVHHPAKVIDATPLQVIETMMHPFPAKHPTATHHAKGAMEATPSKAEKKRLGLLNQLGTILRAHKKNPKEKKPAPKKGGKKKSWFTPLSKHQIHQIVKKPLSVQRVKRLHEKVRQKKPLSKTELIWAKHHHQVLKKKTKLTAVIVKPTVEAKQTRRVEKETREEVAPINPKRITTDFDLLLELIQQKGKISESDALKLLKISPERLQECMQVLEENNLITIDFPPFGPVILRDAKPGSNSDLDDTMNGGKQP